MSELHTSKEWLDIYIERGLQKEIIFPTGWPVLDFNYAFFEELITEEEYLTRCSNSTILLPENG